MYMHVYVYMFMYIDYVIYSIHNLQIYLDINNFVMLKFNYESVLGFEN